MDGRARGINLFQDFFSSKQTQNTPENRKYNAGNGISLGSTLQVVGFALNPINGRVAYLYMNLSWIIFHILYIYIYIYIVDVLQAYLSSSQIFSGYLRKVLYFPMIFIFMVASLENKIPFIHLYLSVEKLFLKNCVNKSYHCGRTLLNVTN